MPAVAASRFYLPPTLLKRLPLRDNSEIYGCEVRRVEDKILKAFSIFVLHATSS